MKKIAASVGFVDIVGVKLGMTPEQAVAAVKAYNPNLKIVTLTARLEHPSGPPGNFVRVPYTIDAYTANNRQDLGPVEWIAMQFTMPPGPPLLAKVQRFTGFLVSQPVMTSNLVESLRKKYGQDNYASTGRGWGYDSNGKLLTRVSNLQGICAGDGMAMAVPGGGATHEGSETGAQVSLSNTTDPSNPGLYNLPEAGPDCAPIVWVVASSNVGEDAAPNSQQTSMTVTMESGALMYMSRRATHAWLQVYIPGAGWIGMDPTSGLFVGEGHIPLACTPNYASAAPVVGATDECETEFFFSNTVTRIHEDPRVTKPYTEEQWATINATGYKVDEDLKAGDLRLTMGGEPTFVSIDDMESAQWNTEADGAGNSHAQPNAGHEISAERRNQQSN